MCYKENDINLDFLESVSFMIQSSEVAHLHTTAMKGIRGFTSNRRESLFKYLDNISMEIYKDISMLNSLKTNNDLENKCFNNVDILSRDIRPYSDIFKKHGIHFTERLNDYIGKLEVLKEELEQFEEYISKLEYKGYIL